MRGELIVRDILRAAFPEIQVDTERIATNALSDDRYVFVQSVGGGYPHPGNIAAPSVEVIVYGRGQLTDVGRFADSITDALHKAWADGFITDHGFLTRFEVGIIPRPQPISGLPMGVHRYSASYSIVTRHRRS